MDSDSTVPCNNSFDSNSDLSDSLSDISDQEITLNNNDDNTSEVESEVPLKQRLDNFTSDLTWTEEGKFSPIHHPFCDINAGVQTSVGLNIRSKPVDIFKSFFTSEIVEMICFQTNIYKDNTLTARTFSGNLNKNSRILKYQSLAPDELYVFLCLRMLMGIIKKTRYFYVLVIRSFYRDSLF